MIVSVVGPNFAGKSFVIKEIESLINAQSVNCASDLSSSRVTAKRLNSTYLKLVLSLLLIPRLFLRALYIWRRWGNSLTRSELTDIGGKTYLLDESHLKKLLEALPLRVDFFKLESILRQRWMLNAIEFELTFADKILFIIPDQESLMKNVDSRSSHLDNQELIRTKKRVSILLGLYEEMYYVGKGARKNCIKVKDSSQAIHELTGFRGNSN